MPELDVRNGCADLRESARQSRRQLLSVGTASVFGLGLDAVLRSQSAEAAPTASAKSIILLYQWGGPSHLETFDMKPNGSDQARGEFKPISSSLDGLQVCELLPRFSKVMHHFSVVRSLTHKFRNHNPPGYYGLTGKAPPLDDQRLRDTPDLFPHYGSVIDKLKPSPPHIPSFVAMPAIIHDGSVVPGQHASFLGKAHDPLLILQDPNSPDFKLPELSLPRSLSLDRLGQRRELLGLLDRQSRLLERSAVARGIDTYHQKAMSMLASPQVKAAFDLNQESPKLRDAYGRNLYGQSVLLARRLIETGVRIVTVYYCRPSGGFIWDTHKQNFPELKNTLLPTTDAAVPTLIQDLKDRGLFDDTLVIWMGEFGRTPKINTDAGRDHWPECYTALLAGGGMKRGFIYGASDANGAYPTDDPVKPDNIGGTLYRALGIDPHTEVRDLQNRPLPIAGDPIQALFA